MTTTIKNKGRVVRKLSTGTPRGLLSFSGFSTQLHSTQTSPHTLPTDRWHSKPLSLTHKCYIADLVARLMKHQVSLGGRPCCSVPRGPTGNQWEFCACLSPTLKEVSDWWHHYAMSRSEQWLRLTISIREERLRRECVHWGQSVGGQFL